MAQVEIMEYPMFHPASTCINRAEAEAAGKQVYGSPPAPLGISHRATEPPRARSRNGEPYQSIGAAGITSSTVHDWLRSVSILCPCTPHRMPSDSHAKCTRSKRKRSQGQGSASGAHEKPRKKPMMSDQDSCRVSTAVRVRMRIEGFESAFLQLIHRALCCPPPPHCNEY